MQVRREEGGRAEGRGDGRMGGHLLVSRDDGITIFVRPQYSLACRTLQGTEMLKPVQR